MSTGVVGRLRRFEPFHVTVDRHAILMALLFLVVQAGAIWLAVSATTAGVESSPPGGVEGSAAGAAWVGVEVAFAAFLLAVIAIYTRAPEWVRDIIRRNAIAGVILWIGLSLGRSGSSNWFIVWALAAITILMLLDEFDLYWLFNNLAAVVMAIVLGAAIAIMFGVEALLIALVGFTAYDYYFADKNTWMFSIGEFLLRIRLPLVVFVPGGWRLDWDGVVDAAGGVGEEDPDDEDDDPLAWGIGMADLMLPAGVAAALAVSTAPGVFAGSTMAVVGVVAGTVLACFRLRHKLVTKGSGAGLPPIAAGIVGGWAVALVATGVLSLVAL